MKTATLLLALMGAADALVMPRAPRQHRLLHTPAAGNKHTLLLSAASSTTASIAAAQDAESTRGGAVIPMANVMKASATFQVPYPSVPVTPPLGASVYTASFWVGIDGVSACPSAGIRAGVDIFNDDVTGVDAYAWVQWYPLQETDVSGNFSVAPGDNVRITVTAMSTTWAGLLIENLSTGATGTKVFSGSDDVAAHPLCLAEAAVIVDDVPFAALPQFPSPFANFTSVSFSDVTVIDGSLETGHLGGALVTDINEASQGGKLTDCKVVGTSTLVCDRVAIASS